MKSETRLRYFILSLTLHVDQWYRSENGFGGEVKHKKAENKVTLEYAPTTTYTPQTTYNTTSRGTWCLLRRLRLDAWVSRGEGQQDKSSRRSVGKILSLLACFREYRCVKKNVRALRSIFRTRSRRNRKCNWLSIPPFSLLRAWNRPARRMLRLSFLVKYTKRAMCCTDIDKAFKLM